MHLIMALTVLIAGAAPAVAQQSADIPPWNIDGEDWICSQGCAPGLEGASTKVVQNGGRFLFVNETGQFMQAQWNSGLSINFVNCDNNATLSPDLKSLTFESGGYDVYAADQDRFYVGVWTRKDGAASTSGG